MTKTVRPKKVKTTTATTARSKTKKADRSWVKLPSFDVSTEPCVPVAMLGAHDPTKVSIGDLVLRSDEIAAVSTPSPSAWVGAMRTGIAINQRVSAPRTGDDWLRLVRDGIDKTAAQVYLNRARQRRWFDLAHEDHPFLQVPTSLLSDSTSDMCLSRANAHSISKMTLIRTAGDEKAHFEKSFDSDPPPLTAGEAALELMGYQACGMGGSRGGDLEGVPPKDAMITYALGPVSDRATSFVLLGQTLAETLSLMALTDEFAAQVVSEEASGPDAPSWEAPPSGRAVREELSAGWRGIMHFLTLQTKRCFLLPKLVDGVPVLGPDGRPVFTHFLNRQGCGWKTVGPVLNPWFAYYKTKKGGYAALSHRTRVSEPAWMIALRAMAADRRPLPVEQAAKYGYERPSVRLRVVGVYPKEGIQISTVMFSENEEVELPSAALDRGRARKVVDALDRYAFGLLETLTEIAIEVDYRGSRRNHTTARGHAESDPAVVFFWDSVKDAAMRAVAEDLAEDKTWLDEIKGASAEAVRRHARRRGGAPEVVMGIAKTLAARSARREQGQ